MDKTQLRSRIRQTLEEFVLTNRQVLINYDITKDYEELRMGLLEEIDIYGKRMITESTYMLDRRLNLDELTELINAIKNRFEFVRQKLNEQQHEPKKVKIVIITTLDNSFFEEVVIDEEI